MVRSIVIPHDQARSPRIRELADVGAFQEAVDGWLDLLEIPALGVTVYMNQAERFQSGPLNQRATALWWLYAAVPTEYPLILGDVVLSGNGEATNEGSGDVPERLVEHIFGPHRFVVQGKSCASDPWRDTYARFDNLFDAATWCLLLSLSMRPGPQFRVVEEPVVDEHIDHELLGGERSW
jgi:hypothetical protein